MNEPKVLCPSSTAQEGAILLGVVMPDGSVAYLEDQIQVDANFLKGQNPERPLETRFRFSSPCAKAGCKQWTGSACGVIERVLEATPELSQAGLPACSIRAQCRWYGQRGAEACGVCPLVITDSRPRLEPRELIPGLAADATPWGLLEEL